MHNPHRRPISHKGLIGIGRQLKAEYGASLTLDLFCRETGLAPEYINSQFGSWQRFRRALGMTLPASSRDCPLTNDDLLAQLRRLGAENVHITLCEFCRQVGVSNFLIYRRFKSWRDMREAAGLPRIVVRREDISEQQILDDLMRIYQKAGRLPGYHDHKRWGGTISAATMRARYGSWRGVQLRFELYRREYMAKMDPNWSLEKEWEERRRRELTRRTRLRFPSFPAPPS